MEGAGIYNHLDNWIRTHRLRGTETAFLLPVCLVRCSAEGMPCVAWRCTRGSRNSRNTHVSVTRVSVSRGSGGRRRLAVDLGRTRRCGLAVWRKNASFGRSPRSGRLWGRVVTEAQTAEPDRIGRAPVWRISTEVLLHAHACTKEYTSRICERKIWF